MWWEIRHCHFYLVVMQRERNVLSQGLSVVAYEAVTISGNLMRSYYMNTGTDRLNDVVSLTLFVCTSLFTQILQDLKIISHCSFQINNARTRLP